MSFVYFTDRDLGNAFPAILLGAGLRVECHRDHFANDCPDEHWLAEVGQRGWVAITHDSRIRYRRNELAAVERHRVALLVVVGKVPYRELAANFVSTLRRIESFLEQHEAPFIAKVYRPPPTELARKADAPGAVALWYPKDVGG